MSNMETGLRKILTTQNTELPDVHFSSDCHDLSNELVPLLNTLLLTILPIFHLVTLVLEHEGQSHVL